MSRTPLNCEKSCGICEAYQWEVWWNEYTGADLFLFVTYSINNCGQSRPFKYMDRFLLFQKSLEHSRTIFILSHAIPFTPLYPAYPSLLPRFRLSVSPLWYLFSLDFTSFTGFLTPVTPPVYFSHVLAECKDCVRRAPVINNNFMHPLFTLVGHDICNNYITFS